MPIDNMVGSASLNQTPEQIARDAIDAQLRAAGWTIQTKDSIAFHAGEGQAVREYTTDTGPADYVLFVDGQPVGVIEAKKEIIRQNREIISPSRNPPLWFLGPTSDYFPMFCGHLPIFPLNCPDRIDRQSTDFSRLVSRSPTTPVHDHRQHHLQGLVLLPHAARRRRGLRRLPGAAHVPHLPQDGG